jgi:hypothetical protein
VTYAPINFADKLARFGDHWSPKIIAQMNDYHFKLVKVQGGTINTGAAQSALTAKDGVWV